MTNAISKNTVVVCTEAPPDGFDIVRYSSLTTTNASADLLFDSLVSLNERGEIKPSLATHWDISEDGSQYTFHLRQNVSFHKNFGFSPTRYFNADDVLASIRRLIDNSHPWHKATGESTYPTAESLGLASLIKSVYASPDKQQITFILTKPDRTFLPMLSMSFLSIYSQEYMEFLTLNGVEKNSKFKKENINTMPIGTGPFLLKIYRRPNEIRYIRNPNYWASPAKIDNLIYSITPNASTRIQKIKNSECQIALSPLLQEIDTIKKWPSIGVDKNTSFMTAFVAINTEHKALKDVRVRQAINYAFDKNKFIQIAYNGLAKPASLPIPPNNWAFPEASLKYEFNLAKAKSLIKEAGYDKGLKLRLFARSNSSMLIPNPRMSAELLQADLMKIGIQTDIKILEWGELRRHAFTGDFDLLFMGWAGDNGDPDNFLTPLFSCRSIKSGNNFSRHCNPTLDKIIQNAKNIPDKNQRKDAYKQAFTIIYKEALWLPIAHPYSYTLLSNEIHGFMTSPYGRVNFSKLSLNTNKFSSYLHSNYGKTKI